MKRCNREILRVAWTTEFLHKRSSDVKILISMLLHNFIKIRYILCMKNRNRKNTKRIQEKERERIDKESVNLKSVLFY